ncbi:MAG: hypothetical protein KGL95_12735 [Patescibacteria group bacterium]|nr:hypothetical protein [Patescibacteria group bacterium]
MTYTRYYILVGDRSTWNISLTKNIWGFKDSTKGHWNTTNIGDLVAFYVKKPRKKIIGFGKVIRKFIDETQFWPDEKLYGKTIWKYRFEFEILHLLDDWKKGISVPSELILNQGRKVIDQSIFYALMQEADSKWGTKLHSLVPNQVENNLTSKRKEGQAILK